MASYNKMVVIPQDEYVQLTSVQRAQQPLRQQFDELTKKSADFDKMADDPFRQLQLRSSNLEERKLLKEKMRRFITLSTPRQYRSRAESLFDFIQPHIHYNEKGEIIDSASGTVLEGSHIDDLLQHAVRDMRRKLGKPVGWNYFLSQLSNQNVPHNIVGSPTILELTKSKAHSTIGSAASTPRKRNIRKREVTPELRREKDTLKMKRKRLDSEYYRF